MDTLEHHRQARLKELLFLQTKLAVNALFDFLLSPVVLLCGLVDVAQANPPEQSLLKRLKTFGRGYEHWLALFADRESGQRAEGRSADRILRHVELRARRQFRRSRAKPVPPS